MLNRLKRFFLAFFTLNKGEQRAIIILLFLTLIVVIINLFLPRFFSEKKTDYSQFINDIESYRAEQQSIFDSIEIERLQSRGELDLEMARQKLRPSNFDPNNMPKELWKQLGLTDKQIKVIKNYEAKGGTFTSKKDLKRMYCISDAEYQVLEPYIKIKSRFKPAMESPLLDRKIQVNKVRPKKLVYKIVEINDADTTALTNNLHLPIWLAKRIIKYRDLLGGFSYANQLTEVYGIDSNKLKTINDYVVVDPTLVKKLNINESTFKELLRHPYISYEITKGIVKYRSERGRFMSTDELVERNFISESLYIKLRPYLTVK